MYSSSTPPVLILGGQENALSLTRSFGRRRIDVYVSAPATCFALKSRYCSRAIPVTTGMDPKAFWRETILGAKAGLPKCVIFPCSDEAVEFLSEHKAQLAERHYVDDFLPDVHLNMLNKMASLRLASEAGCPIPAFYKVSTIEDVDSIDESVLFPIMIKPIHSHLFRVHYPGKKYLVANNRVELVEKITEVLSKGLEIMVTEIIPGPDDLQSAYFTYVKDDGEELFQYTHQIVRRHPKNSGSACLTITKDLPETAEMGKRFFQGVGYRGMGHVEFKHDLRDGQLKIMECNPRVSAAQAIVTKSGLDMAYRIYCHLTGAPVPSHSNYRLGVRRWWLLEDILAFRELNQDGELSFREWVRSVKGPPLVFPYFSLDDLRPFLLRFWADMSGFILSRTERLWKPRKESPIKS